MQRLADQLEAGGAKLTFQKPTLGYSLVRVKRCIGCIRPPVRLNHRARFSTTPHGPAVVVVLAGGAVPLHVHLRRALEAVPPDATDGVPGVVDLQCWAGTRNSLKVRNTSLVLLTAVKLSAKRPWL